VESREQEEVLGFSKALSIKLQRRYVDAVRAYHDVNLVKDTLKAPEPLLISFKVNVEGSQSRTASKQQHRGNVPSTTI